MRCSMRAAEHIHEPRVLLKIDAQGTDLDVFEGARRVPRQGRRARDGAVGPIDLRGQPAWRQTLAVLEDAGFSAGPADSRRTRSRPGRHRVDYLSVRSASMMLKRRPSLPSSPALTRPAARLRPVDSQDRGPQPRAHARLGHTDESRRRAARQEDGIDEPRKLRIPLGEWIEVRTTDGRSKTGWVLSATTRSLADAQQPDGASRPVDRHVSRSTRITSWGSGGTCRMIRCIGRSHLERPVESKTRSGPRKRHDWSVAFHSPWPRPARRSRGALSRRRQPFSSHGRWSAGSPGRRRLCDGSARAPAPGCRIRGAAGPF